MKTMKPFPIPVITASVTTTTKKYVTQQGFKAIRDGVISSKNSQVEAIKKPDWLKVKLQHSDKFEQIKQLVDRHQLSTVCQEAKCPNISECWSHGTATLMIMGAVCTRACKFCSVDTGNPKGWLDTNEPQKAAATVKTMGLKYVVITSVDRDDLKDGGAAHFAETVAAIKHASPETDVEVLTPDFSGQSQLIHAIVDAGITVYAQNIETVRRLTHTVRDPKAGYQQTLDLLAYVKDNYPHLLTKTSLMVGLGETEQELLDCMKDIRRANVDILTIGQYLRPTKNHLPVERYVSPDEFKHYREVGRKLGFLEVVAGPLVRSSYRAERVLEKNNVGLSS